MSQLKKKRCRHCAKLLGREAFNDNQRSKDGLAASCRACVNRRRRELDGQQRRQGKPTSTNRVEAARRGQLGVVKNQVKGDRRQLTHLLWKTVQDFHTIKKGPEHVAQARFLIRRGAQPHWSMICMAARGGHQDLVDVLLESGIDKNIFVAAALGDERALSRFLARDPGRASATHNGITPLHYCALSSLGKQDPRRAAALVRCAQRLLEAGAAVDAQAEVGGLPQVRPLQCACWTGGTVALAGLLIERGADPAGCLKFALGHFQRHGDGPYPLAELLFAAGIDFAAEAAEILGRFAACGNAKAVAWLLAHGANPNAASEEGWTPLHLAAERNTGVKIVKLLLEHGANRHATTVDGRTPLDLAKLNDKRAAVRYLQRRMQ